MMMTILQYFVISTGIFIPSVLGFKADESPGKCLEVQHAKVDQDWVMNQAPAEGWQVALSSKFLPPLEDAEDSVNFLDTGTDVGRHCGRALLKTPMGDKHVKWECSFIKNNFETRKCIISSGSVTGEESFVSFTRTLHMTHTDNATYILVYGCAMDRQHERAQHNWVVFSTEHPLQNSTKEKVLNAVEELGFDKTSYECSLTSPLAWKMFKEEKCSEVEPGAHIHEISSSPDEMPDFCLNPASPKINLAWVRKHRHSGWHIAMSSRHPPPSTYLQNPETFLDHGNDVTKDCGTAKLQTPNGDEQVRWECSYKEMESRKCVMRLGNNTGHESTIAFSGTVHITHTDNKNYILLYGCMWNRDKTKAHHVWLAVATKIPANDVIRDQILDDVEELGFDKSSYYHCSAKSPLAWTRFQRMDKCPDFKESDGAKKQQHAPPCWTC